MPRGESKKWCPLPGSDIARLRELLGTVNTIKCKTVNESSMFEGSDQIS